MEEVIELLDENSEADKTLRMQLSDLSVDPCAWMAHALMAAIRSDNRNVVEKTLWHHGTGSLRIRKGDIFAGCFGTERKRKRIVVIPVNTTFDTKISWAQENDSRPLVSEKTIHGQWLTRMKAAGARMSDLDVQITESLRAQNIAPIAKHGQGTSSRPEYPLGTISVVSGARGLFYLLAISSFDDNNNAQSTKVQISESLESLIMFYDRCGQGFDLFLPLMGTGLSRASLSHQESFDLITTILSNNKDHIHGCVTVVIYKDDADKVNLLN